jgi:hypothetical protein
VRGKGQGAIVALLLCAASFAQSQAHLPKGVVGVTFGEAGRTKDAVGNEVCGIAARLPDPPAFRAGVKEISYAVALEPRAVKSAVTEVVAPGGQGQLIAKPCNAFTIVRGGFSQTQLGSTLSRLDNAPLKSGSYQLRLIVDGQVSEVTFMIK